jgi:hypothetical protein
MARRMTLGLIAISVFLVFALPASGASLTVFKLTPMIGWEKLEQVNPYATIDSDYVMGLSSPMTGWSNAASSVAQVIARAKVDFDTSEAEISADFIPVSGEIIQGGLNLFAAPTGRQLKGTIVLTARNPNDFPMEGVRVEGSLIAAFQPTVAGSSRGDVRIEGDDPRGLSQADSVFIWDVGSLLPNEAARVEVSVTTRRSSTGGFGFTEEGVYLVDSGFRLTYATLGKDQTRSTTPNSIIAHENPKALGLNTGSSSVASNSFDREWPYLKRPFPERPVPVKPGLGGSVPNAAYVPGFCTRQSMRVAVTDTSAYGSPAHLMYMGSSGTWSPLPLPTGLYSMLIESQKIKSLSLGGSPLVFTFKARYARDPGTNLLLPFCCQFQITLTRAMPGSG